MSPDTVRFIDDRGRKEWDHFELLLAEAIDAIPTNNPNLDTMLHPIFNRERWEYVQDEEYEALLPSMRLSTNLLKVALPFIASFLPNDHIFDYYDDEFPEVILLKPTVTEAELVAAQKELEQVARLVRWQLNYDMYAHVGFGAKRPMEWIGITRLVDTPRPWSEVSDEEIRASDEEYRKNGLNHRPLIIGIMGEYVKVLLGSAKGSEQRLRATFMAAITMTHEIGHAMFNYDFRSFNPPEHREPYVGDGCVAELGFSFICWIFGGFHPNAEREKGSWTMDFQSLLYWEPQYYMSQKKVPFYKTLYSIPVQYLEKVLTQEFWTELLPTRVGFSSRARTALKPLTDDSNPEVATSRVPNFIWSSQIGDFEWKDPTFRMPGYRKGDPVFGLTEEEREYEKELAKSTNQTYFNSLSSEQRRVKFVGDEINGSQDTDSNNEDRLADGLIYDGIVEADEPNPIEPNNETLTRIEVRYLFGTSEAEAAHLGKRARGNYEGENGHRWKRLRRDTLDSEGDDGGIPDHRSLKNFLASTSPHAISSLTRIEAHQFCMDRHLRGYTDLRTSDFWQQGQLNPYLEDVEDLAIIYRIIEYLLMLKAREMERQGIRGGDLLQVKLQSMNGIDYWDHGDLEDFCREQGMNYHGTTRELAERVMHWKDADMLADLKIEREEPRVDSRNAADGHAAGVASLAEFKTRSHLIEFLRARSLPTWGTRKAIVVRTKRCEQDEENIKVAKPKVVRREQTSRLDHDGFETYIFRAALGHSTVTALKSALFIAGKFRPDTNLHLFFYPHETDPLEDDKPLSSYGERDWASLRLKTSIQWTFGPGSLSQHPIDLTGKGKPIIDWAGRKLIPPVENPTPTLEKLGDARKEAIANGAELTFIERLHRLATNGSRLMAVGRVPSKGSVPETEKGALEMLMELEDLVEHAPGEFDPLELQERQLRQEEEVITRSEYSLIPPPGTSHMGDIYHRLQNPRDFIDERPVSWDSVDVPIVSFLMRE